LYHNSLQKKELQDDSGGRGEEKSCVISIGLLSLFMGMAITSLPAAGEADLFRIDAVSGESRRGSPGEEPETKCGCIT
jgi:hypothetical protein